MWKLLRLAAVLALSASLLATKGAAEDEAAIRKMGAEFVAAWNAHDSKALAMFWAVEGDFAGPGGSVAKGRAEVEKLFAEAYSNRLNDAHITSRIDSIRFVKPDVALVDGSFEAVGVRRPDGTAIPAVKGLYTWVVVKHKGKWWIEADRVLPLRLKENNGGQSLPRKDHIDGERYHPPVDWRAGHFSSGVL